jgi:23S rRNA (uridine2552-2'-O)-methyltransferase
MSLSHSSQRWLREHANDPYVKQAQRLGYRSRAVFKLEELAARHKLLQQQDLCVVDLGAAPGGWSQWIERQSQGHARIFALDILDMDPLPGVTFIHGDFTQDEVLTTLNQALAGHKVDLVLSDMAPNMSGVKNVDQPRAMFLAELARDFALQWLHVGGNFVTKLFQGEGSDAYIRTLRPHFAKVVVRKPKASRPRSPEVYLVGEHYHGSEDKVLELNRNF